MQEIKTLSQLIDMLKKGYTVKNGIAMPKSVQNAAQETEEGERHFCVSLANRTIEINSLYSEVYSLCEAYICEGEPDFQVSINEKDIEYERNEIETDMAIEKDSYLETLAVYRKISESMLDYDTFLMHGAVIANGNNAYMFTAKSGTGKTTHIRKWIMHLENAYVLNGDKPLIRITDSEAIAYGTPWCGKEKMNKNSMAPLKAIVLMERAEDNEIEEISFSNAFTFLLQQTYQPEDPEKMKKTLGLLMKLSARIKIYKFRFNNMKDDAFSVAYNALTGENV